MSARSFYVCIGPIFTIEPATDEKGLHFWNLIQHIERDFYNDIFQEASVARGNKIQKVNDVFFVNDFGLSLNLKQSMFPDDKHILRISYDLDFLDTKDILCMKVTSEAASETIVVHKQLYCSCTELNDVDLILPQQYLNLN